MADDRHLPVIDLSREIVDELPRNPMGKVVKPDVADLFK